VITGDNLISSFSSQWWIVVFCLCCSRA